MKTHYHAVVLYVSKMSQGCGGPNESKFSSRLFMVNNMVAQAHGGLVKN